MRRPVFVPLLLALLVPGIVSASSADAAGSVGWAPLAVSEPSSFKPADAVACELEKKCDRFQLLVRNTGDQESQKGQPVKLTDVLPAGITTLEVHGIRSALSGSVPNGGQWNCNEGTGNTTVTCELGEPHGGVAAGRYAPYLQIVVGAPAAGAAGVLTNRVTVEGGGAGVPASTSDQTPIDSALSFGVNEFAFESQTAAGARALVAGEHPWQLTTDVGIPSADNPPHGVEGAVGLFAPARNMRSVSVELPNGLVGLPLATERCEEYALRLHRCPAKSRVGIAALLDGLAGEGEFAFTEDRHGTQAVSFVYNMVPEAGYPAELGFVFANGVAPIVLYANVVRTGSGYRVRVTAPAVPSTAETLDISLTFFGEPGSLNTSGSEAPFLSTPSDCSAEEQGLSSSAEGTAPDFSSRLEIEPWGEQGHVVAGESVVYPSLTGCAALAGLFDPGIGLAPSPTSGESATGEGSAAKDVPSAYSFALKVPQTSSFGEPSTPDVRDVTVSLPEGVTADPSAATGLVGCEATGAGGVNLGSEDIGVHGQDLGDPEATELGEGHEGGDGSPYDDGFYHTAPGHCPSASVLASVEVKTPLLAEPLHGHVFLATPKCGGEGQGECNEASATDGELFSGYIEVAGSGVIVKLPGTISANPVNGQLTGVFEESPQFPFSEVKVHFHGGPRAPVANPQSCGSFAGTSTVSSWAGQKVSGTSPAFEITGCPPGAMPFGPGFSAGVANTQAGASSSFTLSGTREDGEQDLAGLTVSLPEGLIGQVASVEQCPEAQANAGTCSSASEVGEVSATAGPGPEPFHVTGGRAYLTGPYKGGPFGLSVVVPTKAGPFNLGNEVVRASIQINPATSAVTVVSDPLPQKKDGVVFRLRSVTVNVDRSGFIVSPTSCAAQSIGATLTGSQGATANVSTPFQSTGCGNLKFHPEFSASTQGNGTTKGNGASLDVKIGYPQPFTAYSNIAKADVSLPLALSSKLTTLQKACSEQQFAADPANCPAGAAVGVATATSPLLKSPLSGPAILVSHGGRAFPDLDLVLQGEGVTIDLTGNTDIKGGVTYSKFETVPDAPVSSFELNLPEKENSILAAVKNLCAPTKTVTTSKKETKRVKVRSRGHTKYVKKKVTVKVKTTEPEALVMPTELTAQDGAKFSQQTKIAVTGCPKKAAAKKAVKKKGKAKKGTLEK